VKARPRGLCAYIRRVTTTGICGQLMACCTQYPVPSAPAEENDTARTDEGSFLARFADLAALDRGQVAELVR
jgi:hypothetical protein